MTFAASNTSQAKRAGIIQSCYIPWKGYFDFIASVDDFVFLDEVQYTRRDWRNRNKIKTKSGLQWLTIPVDVKGKYLQTIDETQVADAGWFQEHLASLRHAYAQAPHFRREWEWVEPLYESLAGVSSLSEINKRLTRTICERLEIATRLHDSRELSTGSGKNERLLSICSALGAREYLSGPSARGYIDEDAWRDRGVEVAYMTYDGYPEYPQLHGPFEHHVSVLDVFFHTGPDAAQFTRRDS